MRGATHVMIAISAAAGISTLTEIPFNKIPWFTILLSSILPDIDEPSSLISNPSKLFGKYFPRTLGQIADLVVKLLVLPLRLFSKHRGLTHSVFVMLILSITAYLVEVFFSINKEIAFWFALSYGLHIFADYLTPKGVPMMWPLNNRSYSLNLCKTGSALEFVIFFICSLVLVLCSYINLKI